MATVNFMQPDIQAEQDQIQRNRLIAEQLRQQSQQPTPGQMAGRVYVGPSWTQGLARLLQASQAGQMNRQADADTKRLAALLQNKNQADAAGFTEALSGKPAGRMADMGEIDPSLSGMGPVEQTSPAIPPDRNRALQIALGSQNPMIQGAGGALIKDMIPKQAEGVNINGQLVDKFTGRPMGAMIPKQAEPFSLSPGAQRFDATGKPIAAVAPNLVPVNGQMVNPQTAAQVGAPIPKQGDPFSDLVIPGPNGTVVPNTPVIDAKKGIASAGKPVTQVDVKNYNTQENEQSKAYGKSLGEIRANINQAGYDAPKKLAQLRRIEELLTGIDGGKGAPARAALASYAQSAGIKLDPRLGDKEAAEAVAREMAGSLRQPGTGPMTDKDFDNFLQQVPDLSKTANGRSQIIKTMRASIERDQRAAQFARDYARSNKGIIDDNFFDSMAKFYAENPVVMPVMPEKNSRGLEFKDPNKENAYQAWKRAQEGQK